MLACIRLSRAVLPLSPVVASTTSSPEALPVRGSKRRSPRLRWKSPWTVCSRLPRVNSTLVCAGSMVNALCCAGMVSPLEMEVPVDRVQQAAEGKLHLGLRGVDGERPLLRGNGLPGCQQCRGYTESEE